MKIIIPMAGKGSRFLEAADQNPEYANPKPLITIKGKPMIVWAIESLPFVSFRNREVNTDFQVNSGDLVFICRQDHEDDYSISSKLKELFGDDIKIILIDQITRGAAETVLKAKDFVDPAEEVIVSDSDHHFDGRYLYEAILGKDDDVSGVIPVWTPPDKEPKWSYSLVVDGVITSVGEKAKDLAELGAPANIGAYYFKKWQDYTDEVEATIEDNDLTGDEGKKEFYVAPVYHRLINRKGLKIIPAFTPKVWGLGTPKDVKFFEQLDL